MAFVVGTAGWSVPKQHLDLFPSPAAEAPKPSHLERYASLLGCVEVNSSFYRPHRPSTWERWAASTPPHFRFAVKAPKAITHTSRLCNTGAPLQAFVTTVQSLGPKLGPILLQLPPSLAFDDGIAREFFTTLRELHGGAAVLEPRHASWFTPAANLLLREFEIARVAADPPAGSDRAAEPAGWPGLHYWRFHGSPRTYYSPYDQPWIQAHARRLLEHARFSSTPTWVIFDNTALGHATANAIELQRELGPSAEITAPSS